MADLKPLQDGQGLRPDRQGGDRPHPQPHDQGRLIMISSHLRIYTTLTDVTSPHLHHIDGGDRQAARVLCLDEYQRRSARKKEQNEFCSFHRLGP